MDKMNELQKTELDLFLCFAEICKKLDLNYFLVAGSALGAKRHGGFIPWDDDMDVGMYREDYDKFMELVPEMLPENIFLQNYKTDPKYPNVFAKLRNSNTTYIEKTSKNLDINHGIYIDIFPLDGCPEKPFEVKKLNFIKKIYRLKLFSAFELPKSPRGRAVLSLLRLFGCHKRTGKTVAKYEKFISKYSVKESNIICNHGNWYGEKDYIPKEFYGQGKDIEFEGVKARVPEKCEEYLAALYGDWQTPPPPEKQIGHHFYEVCDTNKPYTEYMK